MSWAIGIRAGFADSRSRRAPRPLRWAARGMAARRSTRTCRHGNAPPRRILFTNIWLGDALQRTLDPRLPTVMNSDGEEIAFTTVRYPLKEPVDRAALADLLTAIPVLHPGGRDSLELGGAGCGAGGAARAPRERPRMLKSSCRSRRTAS